MTQQQKVEATQLALRLGLTASTAVVVGSTILTAVLFLAVATASLSGASTTLVSVWCVPVLIKI
jgi:hypothetical protein